MSACRGSAGGVSLISVANRGGGLRQDSTERKCLAAQGLTPGGEGAGVDNLAEWRAGA